MVVRTSVSRPLGDRTLRCGNVNNICSLLPHDVTAGYNDKRDRQTDGYTTSAVMLPQVLIRSEVMQVVGTVL